MNETTMLKTQCCIAGGGPAGMMLGFLLARAGVDVVVLEKHLDFLRDFRGDTIHPSTLAVMSDLGLLEAFLELPHQKVTELTANVYGHPLKIADFSGLDTPCPFIALMPQWDFLDFMAEQARRLPRFRLMLGTKAVGVIERDGVVCGVDAETASGRIAIEADLTVAADGRHTTLRGSADLADEDHGAPIDVLWFRVARAPTDPLETGGYVRAGAFLVTLNRDDYWQCAYLIPKGGIDAVHAAGLDALRAKVAGVAPFLREALEALKDWDQIKLLTVQISSMPRWYRDGLLCIGDAAHAMSPVGGVGINLAIQDAVATSNLLAVPLREGRLTTDDLAAVQKRRELPTRVTQRVQIAIQNEVLAPVLTGTTSSDDVPLPLRLLQRFPLLQRIPARVVGIGVRPERVETKAV